MRTFGGMVFRPLMNPIKKKTNKIVARERRIKRATARRRARNKIARQSRRVNRMR